MKGEQGRKAPANKKMTIYYQLRTLNLTKKDGWLSTFDDFNTLKELNRHIEFLEENSPVGIPECIAREYQIKRLYKD